ncbi:MAG: ATP synthase subunit I [Candidatus Zixiibacteriota bacterium]
MGIEFIHRVIKTSLVLAVLILLFVTVYYDFKFGAGILAGSAWGCLNLYFMTKLITEIFSPGKEVKKRKVVLIAVVKFPLLYLAGYLLFKMNYFPPISLVCGFTLIFLVIFLKAMGRWILSMNKGKDERAVSEKKIKEMTNN